MQRSLRCLTPLVLMAIKRVSSVLAGQDTQKGPLPITLAATPNTPSPGDSVVLSGSTGLVLSLIHI